MHMLAREANGYKAEANMSCHASLGTQAGRATGKPESRGLPGDCTAHTALWLAQAMVGPGAEVLWSLQVGLPGA